MTIKDGLSFGCYIPVDNGFAFEKGEAGKKDERIGAIREDPRSHRRALFSCCDKTLVWDEEQYPKTRNYGFRPLAVAYGQPRFMLDYHSAGGVLGHLWIGIVKNGRSKWLHECSDAYFAYENGEMRYRVSDPAFPDVEIELRAIALSGAAGLLVRVELKRGDGAIIWAYGGASGIFHHWVLKDDVYSFKADDCAKDSIELFGNHFTLARSFDETDSYFTTHLPLMQAIPDWTARLTGGYSSPAALRLGSPGDKLQSPAAFWENSRNQASSSGGGVVAGRAEIGGGDRICHIAVGMGGNIQNVLADFESAWDAARGYNADILDRIVVKTPDPYLDAAVAMTALITEGAWGHEAYLHGAWSWRLCYLGWRGWYAPVCFGRLDRVKTAIQNHISISYNRCGDNKGAIGHRLEDGDIVYYNMNEVFIDQLRYYLKHSNDTGMLRDAFTIVNGVVEWEDRRLRPGTPPLYESSLNTWISDSHWYIGGQCAQASAYMYRANKLLADLARLLGEDAEPFETAALEIYKAMQETLWIKRKGVFAESLDTRGECQMHPEPELATLYHTIEFGLADPFQTAQMLDWAARNLRTEDTAGGGKLYWSSNWFPNRGRMSTHSTYLINYGEICNFAIAQFISGNAEEGYALLRGCMNGFFGGPAPGGLACQCNEDGTQLGNEDFADSNSMFVRAVVEGLFGIYPDMPRGKIAVTPMLPKDWDRASVKTPLFSYDYKKEEGRVTFVCKSPEEIETDLHLPLEALGIACVFADGAIWPYDTGPGAGFTWVHINLPRGKGTTVSVEYIPRTCEKPRDVLRVRQGESLAIEIDDVIRLYDPQELLSGQKISGGKLRGVITGEPGTGLLFALRGEGRCAYWEKIPLDVAPAEERAPPIWKAPEKSNGGLSNWTLIDISAGFNAVTPAEAIEHVANCAPAPDYPASTIGFEYWLEHLIGRGIRKQAPSLDAWKAKIGAVGVAWTYEGIPFKSAADGPCLAVVSLAGGYPAYIDFDVKSRGKELYLMLTGVTFPAQSHVANLRVTLFDDEGRETIHELFNPTDIGDCWSVWAGRFHDTARNGFENLGGRFGAPGSHMVDDMTLPVETDTEAHLLALPIEGMYVSKIRLQAAANDVIFALMGISILE